MMSKLQTLILALTLTAGAVAHADDDLVAIKPLAANALVANQTPAELIASLHFQRGLVKLPSGIATIKLPEQYEYLAPEDANKLLVSAWGNPKREDTQGLIVSTNHSLLGPNGWAVVVRYSGDGHVREADAEAEELHYDDIIKALQKQTDDQSAERFKNGYSSISLLGWAEMPSYNTQLHEYTLAKELAVLGNPETTLNYNIRMLTRRGVLDLNAVASMHDFNQVKTETEQLAGLTEIAVGQSYSDFDRNHDPIAGYTVTEMVTGYVSQLGWLSNLWATLIALKYAVATAALAFLLALFGFVYYMRRIKSTRVYLR